MIHSLILFPHLQCCYLFVWREKKSELLVDAICVPSFFCNHKTNWVQWVLCLISIIRLLKSSLFLQSCCLWVRWERRKVNSWWMSFVRLLLYSRLRLSFVSVVFDFNDSLNDVAPVYLMLFAVYVKRKGKEWIVDECCLYILPFVLTTQIERSECSVWFQWLTHWFYSCVSNLVVCWGEEKGKRVNC